MRSALFLMLPMFLGCASIPESSPFPAGGVAKAPAGWVAYCDRKPGDRQCKPHTAVVQALTAEGWLILEDINWRVNMTPYKSDDELFGGPYWDQTGQDCEDYALNKRDILAMRGISMSGVAVARDETGTLHAVLAVHTTKGVYILDNRRKHPTPWAELPYEWVSFFDPKTNIWRDI